MCQSADHVVGLESCVLDDRNAEGLESAPDIGNLLRKVCRHLRAVRLVSFVRYLIELLRLDVEFAYRCHRLRPLIAKYRRTGIKNGGEVLWREIAAELVDHVHEDI